MFAYLLPICLLQLICKLWGTVFFLTILFTAVSSVFSDIEWMDGFVPCPPEGFFSVGRVRGQSSKPISEHFIFYEKIKQGNRV